MDSFLPTHIATYMRMYTHTHAQICMCTHTLHKTHTHITQNTHTRIHTHTYTHTRTHTHTHQRNSTDDQNSTFTCKLLAVAAPDKHLIICSTPAESCAHNYTYVATEHCQVRTIIEGSMTMVWVTLRFLLVEKLGIHNHFLHYL